MGDTPGAERTSERQEGNNLESVRNPARPAHLVLVDPKDGGEHGAQSLPACGENQVLHRRVHRGIHGANVHRAPRSPSRSWVRAPAPSRALQPGFSPDGPWPPSCAGNDARLLVLEWRLVGLEGGFVPFVRLQVDRSQLVLDRLVGRDEELVGRRTRPGSGASARRLRAVGPLHKHRSDHYINIE